MARPTSQSEIIAAALEPILAQAKVDKAERGLVDAEPPMG
jgi:hypothetical protein